MATAYVYSPRSGSAISLNCYCNRSWTSGTSICSGTCPGNNCQCTGTSCQSNQNCATCTNPCLCKNCCWHVITQSGYQRPIDISSAADSWIYAYLSAAVASVKRRWSAGLCAGVAATLIKAQFWNSTLVSMRPARLSAGSSMVTLRTGREPMAR